MPKQVYTSNQKSTFLQELAGAALYKAVMFMDNKFPGFTKRHNAERVLNKIGLTADTNYVQHATLDENGNLLDWGDSFRVPVIKAKPSQASIDSGEDYNRNTKGCMQTPDGTYRNPERKFKPLVIIAEKKSPAPL